jgi:hypothetical protein
MTDRHAPQYGAQARSVLQAEIDRRTRELEHWKFLARYATTQAVRLQKEVGERERQQAEMLKADQAREDFFAAVSDAARAVETIDADELEEYAAEKGPR